MIFSYLVQDTFGGVLVNQAKLVLPALEARDATKLLKAKSIAKWQVIVMDLIGGYANVGPLGKL
jgi:hypothetical protein